LAARRLAVHLVAGVLRHRRPLEQVLADASRRPDLFLLPARDRGLARLVAATVLRRQGELEGVLNAFLERPLPTDQGQLWPILLCAAAQLLCLALPAHAVVDLAVELVRRDKGAHRFAKLSNAVLRRLSERGAGLLAAQDGVRLNIPSWLWQRWSDTYGPDTARQIGEASLSEAALDLSLKPGEDVGAWADRLGASRCRRARSALQRLVASRSCRDMHKGPGGSRMPPPLWLCGWPATWRACPWPIYARHRAAKRLSSPPRALW
jgi:16S rRNA (cytosine967-C5)-methyltransferase